MPNITTQLYHVPTMACTCSYIVFTMMSHHSLYLSRGHSRDISTEETCVEDHCLIQKHGSYVLFSFFPRLREGRKCGKVLALLM